MASTPTIAFDGGLHVQGQAYGTVWEVYAPTSSILDQLWTSAFLKLQQLELLSKHPCHPKISSEATDHACVMTYFKGGNASASKVSDGGYVLS